MVLHADRVEKRHNRTESGNNFRHAHYHPNTKKPEKRTLKPTFNLYISVKCQRCGKKFERNIDSQFHFVNLVEKKGWKNVDFTKSEENTNASAKDIHGICCPDCQKDIDLWKKDNHPKKAEASGLSAKEKVLLGEEYMGKVETLDFNKAIAK
jgi:endogenous inhibitor of DNA gyrase (YacG/DUF329 family)